MNRRKFLSLTGLALPFVASPLSLFAKNEKVDAKPELMTYMCIVKGSELIGNDDGTYQIRLNNETFQLNGLVENNPDGKPIIRAKTILIEDDCLIKNFNIFTYEINFVGKRSRMEDCMIVEPDSDVKCISCVLFPLADSSNEVNNCYIQYTTFPNFDVVKNES